MGNAPEDAQEDEAEHRDAGRLVRVDERPHPFVGQGIEGQCHGHVDDDQHRDRPVQDDGDACVAVHDHGAISHHHESLRRWRTPVRVRQADCCVVSRASERRRHGPALIVSLTAARAAASSRLSPPPTPWQSVAIHAAVFVAWIALFVLAFVQGGVLAWSVGIAYIAYDTLLQAFVFWQTWALRKPLRQDAVARGRCSVGVIVAAHNEAKVLEATLGALLGQSDPPDVVVIADDGSTDATAHLLLEQYALVAPEVGAQSAAGTGASLLSWLRLPHGGKARALNAAIVGIGTDIVLTVDADTLLDRRAIATVRRAFEAEPELVAVTGT